MGNRMKEHIQEIREKEKDTEYVLFIARDDYEYDEYDESFTAPGKLHIFYDKPELLTMSYPMTYYWGNARMICEIPTYMFPNIKENTCVKFNTKNI